MDNIAAFYQNPVALNIRINGYIGRYIPAEGELGGVLMWFPGCALRDFSVRKEYR